MAVLVRKLGGNGLYLFDEPEAALSPSRQLAALSAIHRLVEDAEPYTVTRDFLAEYPRYLQHLLKDDDA